jgi:hypothetical protein
MYNLVVEADLYKNWSVLQTQRLQVESIVSLLSNLSGSILGVMGILGFVMNQVEENYMKYQRKKGIRNNFSKLVANSKKMFYKNFFIKNNQNSMVNSDLNIERSLNANIQPNSMMLTYNGESLSTFRFDDPMNYKVEGLDIP